jgi:FkbM family methyltransferase
MMLNRAKAWLKSRLFDPGQRSFSQCGEDRIVNLVAKVMGLSDIYYLDIGACHPISLSNTYFFYLAGNCGVCVEADPARAELIARHRGRDACLNFGVCGQEGPGTRALSVMRSRAMNTFRDDFAQDSGSEIVGTVEVPMISVNELVRTYCHRVPNFVSLDVEGMDEEILRAFDFDRGAPEILCIETLTHGTNQTKCHDLIDFVVSKGYVVVADTYVNTIFARSDVWSAARPGLPSTIFPKFT